MRVLAPGVWLGELLAEPISTSDGEGAAMTAGTQLRLRMYPGCACPRLSRLCRCGGRLCGQRQSC